MISTYLFYKDPGESFDNYENCELAFEILMIIFLCKIISFVLK